MTVSLRDWETSIVDIDLKDYHPQKAVDFLNKLVEVYRIDNVEKKNQYADQTINFIEYLLEGVERFASSSRGGTPFVPVTEPDLRHRIAIRTTPFGDE